MKWPAHKVPRPIAHRRLSKQAARLEGRRDLADLKAILEFAQEDEPNKACLERLSDWLPADSRGRHEVRETLRNGLRQLFLSSTDTDGDVVPFWLVRPSHGLSVMLEKSGVVSYHRAKIDDALPLRAIEVLRDNIGHVRKCARKGCERLFVPNKRQTYCSPDCSQKARFAKYRRSFTPEQWREKRRREHIKRVIAEKGIGAARHVRRRAPRRTDNPTTKEG